MHVVDGHHDSEEALLGQAADEYFDAINRGERPSLSAIAARFPQVASQIREVFPLLDLVDPQCNALAVADDNRVPLAGRLGDYRLVQELGRGGMGVVYEAEQLSTGRRVALKVLPFAGLAGESALKRFQNEIRTAASLEHPHIVAVFAGGEERGVHYFAMQLVRGQSLAEVLTDLCDPASAKSSTAGASSGPSAIGDRAAETIDGRMLTTERSADRRGYFCRIAELGRQACSALQYAHGMGVVHRDIKPSNLLLDAAGRLWLTDFGLALSQGSGSLTMTGDVVGTLRYMSPEQARGGGLPVDHRADVYSLGATLYELATLQPAFPETDRQSLLRSVSERPPLAPRIHDSSIPADLETIILKCLEKEPVDRYASVAELSDDLERFLVQRPIHARLPSLMRTFVKWTQRHHSAVAVGGIMTIAALLGLSLSTYLIYQSRQTAVTALDSVIGEKQRAEKNLDFALQAVDEIYSDFVGRDMSAAPGLSKFQERYLRKAVDIYGRLATENSATVSHWPEAGRLYTRLGIIHQRLGDFEKSIESYDRSVTIYHDLIVRNPNEISYCQEMAESLIHGGALALEAASFGMAISWSQEAILSLDGVREAEPQRWRGSKAQLLKATAHAQLAVAYTAAGQLDAADEEFKDALSLSDGVERYFDDDARCLRWRAGVRHDIALLRRAQGRVTEGVEVMQAAIADSRRALATNSGDPGYRQFLNRHLAALADLYVRAGDADGALECLKEGCQLANELADEYPDRAQLHADALAVWSQRADFHAQHGDHDAAAQARVECIASIRAFMEQLDDEPLGETLLAYLNLFESMEVFDSNPDDARRLIAKAQEQLARAAAMAGETPESDVTRYISAVRSTLAAYAKFRRAADESDVGGAIEALLAMDGALDEIVDENAPEDPRGAPLQQTLLDAPAPITLPGVDK